MARRRLAMPPVFTGAAKVPLRLLRVIDIPPEVLSLLRYGRGVDTSAFIDTGFDYRYTTPATVEAFAKARRLERVVGTPPEYEYEHDVEDFLRNSRAVVRPGVSSFNEVASSDGVERRSLTQPRVSG